MPPPSILRIAFPGPLRSIFDYLPPTNTQQIPSAGIRLKAPFGRSSRCGVLVETISKSEIPASRLKRVDHFIDSSPLLKAEDLAFLKWAAGYYQHPLGDAIFHALPVNLRKGGTPAADTIKAWRLTSAGARIVPDELKRAPRQGEILTCLKPHPEGLAQQALFNQCRECRTILRALLEKKWVEPCTVNPTAIAKATPAPAPSLNKDQVNAISQISLANFRAYLLDGVTGSGKTEVYLSLIEKNLCQDKQTLVLVPEIGLTPQLVQRFHQRLGLSVALLHSGLSAGERERHWLGAQSGKAQVVVGARSAIFTPMPRLGLILVDEEHDLSFKQQEGFRYSARDLAIVRARRHNCPVVLGSATPSLESLHNVCLNRYIHLQLPERVGRSTLPNMDLIDIRSAPLKAGLSPVLVKQIKAKLQSGEQVMLFLNRRGFSPLLTCHACGWLSDCPRCDARMTLHLTSNLLWCHHCGHQHRAPSTCPDCGSPDLLPLGQGTQRLESTLNELFPNSSVARIDRDSTRRKGSLEKLLTGIWKGDYKLLIGTQMLAKGHHFPNVTLVALIDVDQGLFGADYRASERMAQLIIQVAGRAGRADKPGQVLIQTRHQDHPLLQTLVHQGYAAFASQGLHERRAANLPPFSYQALLRAESTQENYPSAFLEASAELGKTLPKGHLLEFWGPVPAPMERRAGKIRAHLLIQSADRAILQAWLKQWTASLEKLPSAKRVRWSLDVDPQEMF